ncbi:protein of unknown function [Geodermatophilus dictyosporus]|uniref:DUF1772 domain-containing protein n=1 Tax=Geodermatophilus dictyosporus TaxID=1523247 RepID=A0A1I5K1C4_9ACTN|nr:DUF1772 domain-containing protein [Geodermatophilus dictyosporus]SFO78827.1 protein of unknown function [Geodermatophilus dictyosporus]
MEHEHTSRVARWARPLGLASATSAGVLTGGMVFIEVVLVPSWRATPPAEFRRWFTAHAGRIRSLMIPLGAGAGATSLASAVTQLVGRRRSGAAVVAAVATGGVVAVTLAVNEPANDRFTSGRLTDPETRDLLRTWARWHHVRVVLGLVATVAATWAAQEAGVARTAEAARP